MRLECGGDETALLHTYIVMSILLDTDTCIYVLSHSRISA